MDDLTRSVSIRQRGARGVAFSLGAQVCRFILQFASQILLARLLLPADFGLLAMAIPVITLAQTLGELGLAQAVIQRPELTRQDISLLLCLSIAVNVALAVALAVAAPLFALFFSEPRLTPILVALSGTLILNGIGSQQMAIMTRHMQFGRMAAIDVICLAIAIIAGLACALAGIGYWSLVIMQLTNLAVIAALATVLSGWRPTAPRHLRHARPLLTFGAHLTGFNVLTYLGNNLDSIAIGAIDGPIALGIYDRAMKLIVTPLWQISLPLGRVATGILARLQSRSADYRRTYIAMLQGFLAVTAPGFACAALTAKTLVPAVLGPQWTASAPVMAWLCVSGIFMSYSVSASWLFISQGLVREQLNWGFVRTGLGLAALAAGLPWGVLGVAISYAITAPLVRGTMIWGATRAGPVRLPDILRGTYPVALATTIGAALAAWILTWLPDKGPWIQIAATLTTIYLAGFATLCCLPSGHTLMQDANSAWQALRHRGSPRQPRALITDDLPDDEQAPSSRAAAGNQTGTSRIDRRD